MQASQVALVVKNLFASAGDVRNMGWTLCSKIPWRRKWQPTPAFLPGESHGQRSLVGHSPWGSKELHRSEGGAWWAAVCGVSESDTTEAT